MGFCLLNNVAVAAAALGGARRARRSSSTGTSTTATAPRRSSGTTPASSTSRPHQWPLYPGSGAAEEIGGAGAPGLTVNVPLPAGATGDVVRRALDDVVAPARRRASPRPGCWSRRASTPTAADPLADLASSAGDFAALALDAARARRRAAGALALFLEGGYDLDALRNSTAAALGALLGAGEPAEAPTAGGPGAQAVADAARERARALGER